MHLELEGEANDYVGKGLSGGEITIRPFRRAAYADVSHQHLIIGNTVLYGATAGKLFAAGQAGDRFAVRNSGAIAVIEGAGNHCCEYMTGGDRGGARPRRPELRRRDVERRGLRAGRGRHFRQPDQPATWSSSADLDERDVELLHRLMREHEEQTASPRARTILVQWESSCRCSGRLRPRGRTRTWRRPGRRTWRASGCRWNARAGSEDRAKGRRSAWGPPLPQAPRRAPRCVSWSS